MFEVPEARFEQFLADAIDGIPDNVAKAMDNVVFLIEDDPADGVSLGLYDGIPITERRSTTYPFVLPVVVERPDRIVVYRHAIERACGSESGVRDQVRRTLYEQVARLFGVADGDTSKLGWADD
jgi:predicted Zn-dependent protease with MMP-like domain